MTKIQILIEGYVRNSTEVVPTTTLVQDGDINIIIDPGMGKNKRESLEEALKKENLGLNDIDIIFCTHYHLDHTRFVGLFPKVKLIDYLYVYDGDTWTDHEGEGYKLSPNVSILHTPGHTPEHASLKVETENGIVVVAGDVWWFDTMEPKIDEMALDQKELERSRKKVLGIADFVIPGHGKMFKIK